MPDSVTTALASDSVNRTIEPGGEVLFSFLGNKGAGENGSVAAAAHCPLLCWYVELATCSLRRRTGYVAPTQAQPAFTLAAEPWQCPAQLPAPSLPTELQAS